MKTADLQFMNGPRRGDIIPIRTLRTVIGRRVGDVIVDDPTVSGLHAVVIKQRRGWFVTDLDSRNGLVVDGHTCRSREVVDGSRIRVGDTVLMFRSYGESSQVRGIPGWEDLAPLPHVVAGDTLAVHGAADEAVRLGARW